MTPVDQTTFGQPGGNCFSAAVASLLELDIADVPYFMDERGDRGHWSKQLDAWLAPRGFYSMHFGLTKENRKFYTREKLWPAGFYILNGKSPRGDHSVVAHRDAVVHDPHPLRDFIVDSMDGFVLLVTMFGAAPGPGCDCRIPGPGNGNSKCMAPCRAVCQCACHARTPSGEGR